MGYAKAENEKEKENTAQALRAQYKASRERSFAVSVLIPFTIPQGLRKGEGNMKSLFTRCLNAKYISTAKNGNYAIEVEGDTLYILFQWSKGFWDWVHNFLFPAKPYKRMSCLWFCHRGFLKVWKAMRDEIEWRVKNALSNNDDVKKIVCVGYSHGGALALLATEDMEFLYGDTLTVEGYGFGAPRVLWGFVPKAVKNRLQAFRVIRNIPDIVTHLPPVLLGFRHVASPLKVGKRGRYGLFKAHYPASYITELNSYTREV